MSVSLPHPSSRLLRAAAAEHADLARHRERLTERRATLVAELRQVDETLTAVDERLAVLARLAGTPSPADLGDARNANVAPRPAPSLAAPHNRDAQPPDPAQEVLRGPAIREAAVKVVIAHPQRIEALHYRQWYELLQEAGYAVAGKDPVAVFLTQVSRSPVVRKATKPGVYEVDRQAPLRIRQRLDRLQSELRELAAAASAPIDLGTVRARRHELDLEISQHERALEEAVRVLSPGEIDAAQRGAMAAR